MANMAPQAAYQGSPGMRRVAAAQDGEHSDNPNKLGGRYKREAKRLKTIIEGSIADKRSDRGHREGSKADERADRTIMGKHMKSRIR